MNSTKPEAKVFYSADTLKMLTAGSLILVALVVFYVFANQSLLLRVIGLLVATGVAVAIAIKTQLGIETLEFIQGSHAELRKVVWPTRSETTQTTLIVIAMVIIMGLLLWLLDTLLFWLVRLITS
jgi:preprotein translocase subunit SecE